MKWLTFITLGVLVWVYVTLVWSLKFLEWLGSRV